MRMQRRVTTLAVLLPLLAASSAQAQKLTENPAWFPKRQMMTIGVYYYPQAWPQNQWARDMRNIRKLGMEYVHMGEFSWYFEEPEEGKYNFDWLDKNVALAAKNGLKVILCTSSAAPPVWLLKEHPDVLVVDAQGRRMQFGARANADWNSAV
ncbi:MAG: beta-galactosidase, partial [Bryobacteraceae bacterium]